MLIGHPRQKVYLAVGATDLRKSVDGLAAIVQLDFQLDPFEPCLFAFCNRQQNRVKILEWSERGFWLHYFRLENGRLPWPQESEEVNALDLTWQDLRWLLEGIPLRPSKSAHQKTEYVLRSAVFCAFFLEEGISQQTANLKVLWKHLPGYLKHNLLGKNGFEG